MTNNFKRMALWSLALGWLAAGCSQPKAQEASLPGPCMRIQTSRGAIDVRLDAQAAPQTVANFIMLAEGQQSFKDPGTQERVMRPFYDGLTFHRVVKGFAIQCGCPLGNGEGGPGYRIDDEINAEGLGLDRQRALPGGRPHPWLDIETRQALHQRVLVPLLLRLDITTADQLEARREEVEARFASLSLKEFYELNGYRYRKDLSASGHRRGVLAMSGSGPDTSGSQFFILLADAPHLDGRHTVFGEVIAGMDVVEAIGAVPTDEHGCPTEVVRIESVRRLP